MSARGDSLICPTCQCMWGDSDCVHFTNRGPNSPWVPTWNLADDPDQLAEDGPNGFGLFLPGWLVDPPAVSATHPIDQSIPFDTIRYLEFKNEYYDTDSMHDSRQDTGRFTVNTSGVYLVTLNVTWASKTTSTGDLAAAIMRNTVEIIASDTQPYGDPDDYLAQSVSYQGFFDAGETIEAAVKQDGEDAEGDEIVNRILAERYSPIFTATFLRLEP